MPDPDTAEPAAPVDEAFARGDWNEARRRAAALAASDEPAAREAGRAASGRFRTDRAQVAVYLLALVFAALVIARYH